MLGTLHALFVIVNYKTNFNEMKFSILLLISIILTSVYATNQEVMEKEGIQQNTEKRCVSNLCILLFSNNLLWFVKSFQQSKLYFKQRNYNRNFCTKKSLSSKNSSKEIGQNFGKIAQLKLEIQNGVLNVKRIKIITSFVHEMSRKALTKL